MNRSKKAKLKNPLTNTHSSSPKISAVETNEFSWRFFVWGGGGSLLTLAFGIYRDVAMNYLKPGSWEEFLTILIANSLFISWYFYVLFWLFKIQEKKLLLGLLLFLPSVFLFGYGYYKMNLKILKFQGREGEKILTLSSKIKILEIENESLKKRTQKTLVKYEKQLPVTILSNTTIYKEGVSLTSLDDCKKDLEKINSSLSGVVSITNSFWGAEKKDDEITTIVNGALDWTANINAYFIGKGRSDYSARLAQAPPTSFGYAGDKMNEKLQYDYNRLNGRIIELGKIRTEIENVCR